MKPIKPRRYCLLMVLCLLVFGCRAPGGEIKEKAKIPGQNLSEEETLPFRHCLENEDCVYAMNDCCDCQQGDADLAIHKDEADAFKKALNCPTQFACASVGRGRNPGCGTGTITCDSGLCVYHTPPETYPRKMKYDLGIVPDEATMPYRYCSEDSDCVYVNAGCCDCVTIGREISVNRKELKRFEENQDCPRWFTEQCPTDKEREPPCGSGRSVCNQGVCRYIVPEGAKWIRLDGGAGDAFRDMPPDP